MYTPALNKGMVLIVVLLWMSLFTFIIMRGLHSASESTQMSQLFLSYNIAEYKAQALLNRVLVQWQHTLTDNKDIYSNNSHIKITKMPLLDARFNRCYLINVYAHYQLARSAIAVNYCLNIKHKWQLFNQ